MVTVVSATSLPMCNMPIPSSSTLAISLFCLRVIASILSMRCSWSIKSFSCSMSFACKFVILVSASSISNAILSSSCVILSCKSTPAIVCVLSTFNANFPSNVAWLSSPSSFVISVSATKLLRLYRPYQPSAVTKSTPSG